jgi:hypothetical protein
MHFFWKQRQNPFKPRQEYSKVTDGVERASSDDSRASDDGLMEKEIAELRRKAPFWRRHTALIVLNSIIFIIYAGVLCAVASNVPKQCSKGPNLVFCK